MSTSVATVRPARGECAVARKSVLYLVHRVPYPPNRGDRIRSFHLLRFLSARCDVHLACLADEPVAPETIEALKSWCANVVIVPLSPQGRWLRATSSLARGRSATEGLFYSPRFRDVVGQWARETRFDMAVAFCSSMGRYLELPELAGVRRCIDLVDVDSQKWHGYGEQSHGWRRWLFQLEGRRVQKLERHLAARVDSVTLVSSAEAAILTGFCPDADVHAVTNGVDLEYFQPRPEINKSEHLDCVFVGALDYRANVDGICWFCEKVWPAVKAKYPDATLTLVGRRPDSAVRELAKLPGVVLVGEVPDVRPYLGRAHLAVVPLRVARGIQNKVLEALASGTPLIASPQAIEGIDLIPEVSALCAATPAEWIVNIERLWKSESLRDRLSKSGRDFVEKHHRWERCLQPFERLLKLAPDVATIDTVAMLPSGDTVKM